MNFFKSYVSSFISLERRSIESLENADFRWVFTVFSKIFGLRCNLVYPRVSECMSEYRMK